MNPLGYIDVESALMNLIYPLFTSLENSDYAHLVAWLDNGHAFVVKDPQQFTINWINRHDSTMTYDKFISTLIDLGFTRSSGVVNDIPTSDIFYHPNFRQDRNQLVQYCNKDGKIAYDDNIERIIDHLVLSTDNSYYSIEQLNKLYLQMWLAQHVMLFQIAKYLKSNPLPFKVSSNHNTTNSNDPSIAYIDDICDPNATIQPSSTTHIVIPPLSSDTALYTNTHYSSNLPTTTTNSAATTTSAGATGATTTTWTGTGGLIPPSHLNDYNNNDNNYTTYLRDNPSLLAQTPIIKPIQYNNNNNDIDYNNTSTFNLAALPPPPPTTTTAAEQTNTNIQSIFNHNTAPTKPVPLLGYTSHDNTYNPPPSSLTMVIPATTTPATTTPATTTPATITTTNIAPVHPSHDYSDNISILSGLSTLHDKKRIKHSSKNNKNTNTNPDMTTNIDYYNNDDNDYTQIPLDIESYHGYQYLQQSGYDHNNRNGNINQLQDMLHNVKGLMNDNNSNNGIYHDYTDYNNTLATPTTPPTALSTYGADLADLVTNNSIYHRNNNQQQQQYNYNDHYGNDSLLESEYVYPNHDHYTPTTQLSSSYHDAFSHFQHPHKLSKNLQYQKQQQQQQSLSFGDVHHQFTNIRDSLQSLHESFIALPPPIDIRSYGTGMRGIRPSSSSSIPPPPALTTTQIAPYYPQHDTHQITYLPHFRSGSAIPLTTPSISTSYDQYRFLQILNKLAKQPDGTDKILFAKIKATNDVQFRRWFSQLQERLTPVASYLRPSTKSILDSFQGDNNTISYANRHALIPHGYYNNNNRQYQYYQQRQHHQRNHHGKPIPSSSSYYTNNRRPSVGALNLPHYNNNATTATNKWYDDDISSHHSLSNTFGIYNDSNSINKIGQLPYIPPVPDNTKGGGSQYGQQYSPQYGALGPSGASYDDDIDTRLLNNRNNSNSVLETNPLALEYKTPTSPIIIPPSSLSTSPQKQSLKFASYDDLASHTHTPLPLPLPQPSPYLDTSLGTATSLTHIPPQHQPIYSSYQTQQPNNLDHEIGAGTKRAHPPTKSNPNPTKHSTPTVGGVIGGTSTTPTPVSPTAPFPTSPTTHKVYSPQPPRALTPPLDPLVTPTPDYALDLASRVPLVDPSILTPPTQPIYHNTSSMSPLLAATTAATAATTTTTRPSPHHHHHPPLPHVLTPPFEPISSTASSPHQPLPPSSPLIGITPPFDPLSSPTHHISSFGALNGSDSPTAALGSPSLSLHHHRTPPPQPSIFDQLSDSFL